MQSGTIFTAQRRGGVSVPGSYGEVASQRRGTSSPASRRKVFVCYSHKDQRWLERLQVFLAPLERQGMFDLWSDWRMDAGDQWRREIRKAIDESMAAILLVSADFVASDFIAQNELPPLLQAAATRGVRIHCLIISFSGFDDTPLASFQTVNPPSEPLNKLPKWRQDKYFHRTYSAVKKAMS